MRAYPMRAPPMRERQHEPLQPHAPRPPGLAVPRAATGLSLASPRATPRTRTRGPSRQRASGAILKGPDIMLRHLETALDWALAIVIGAALGALLAFNL
jgi:hypothetical protein